MTFTMKKELFLKELAIGSQWAEYVAAELNAQGIPCEATEMRVAKTQEEIQEFTENDQDVVLLNGSGHFEVKSRRLSFTNYLNYPYDTVFLDTTSGWSQKKTKPIAYLIVSQETGAIIAIPTDTHSEWETTTAFDRIRQFSDTWYTAHRHQMLSFKEFVQDFKEGVWGRQ
jgi:4-hydroxy-3-methylbut-2-enyl diphosphate reductase IspH